MQTEGERSRNVIRKQQVRDQKSQCDGVSRVFQRYDFKFYLQYFKFYCFNFCFKTLLGDYTDDLSGVNQKGGLQNDGRKLIVASQLATSAIVAITTLHYSRPT